MTDISEYNDNVFVAAQVEADMITLVNIISKDPKTPAHTKDLAGQTLVATTLMVASVFSFYDVANEHMDLIMNPKLVAARLKEKDQLMADIDRGMSALEACNLAMQMAESGREKETKISELFPFIDGA